jgi:Asp-tRNA(Asn)/Glu-tRNA(Gln) amidotransferase A subunit family amidase
MKGTPGRIPRGVRGLAQLTCSGVVAAEIDDLVTAIEVASGSHPLDPLALPPWRCESELESVVPRVAFSPDLGYAPPDAAVEAAVRGRLEHLYAGRVIDLLPVPVEVTDPTEAWLALYAVDRGEPVDEAALAAALEYRRALDLTLATVFSQVDVLVTPTTPQTAFPYADYEDSLPAGDLTWVFNVSGHPAISVPVALVDGLPVGAQVVAPPHCDGLAINVARTIIEPLGTPPAHVLHLGTPS